MGDPNNPGGILGFIDDSDFQDVTHERPSKVWFHFWASKSSDDARCKHCDKGFKGVKKIRNLKYEETFGCQAWNILTARMRIFLWVMTSRIRTSIVWSHFLYNKSLEASKCRYCGLKNATPDALQSSIYFKNND